MLHARGDPSSEPSLNELEELEVRRLLCSVSLSSIDLLYISIAQVIRTTPGRWHHNEHEFNLKLLEGSTDDSSESAFPLSNNAPGQHNKASRRGGVIKGKRADRPPNAFNDVLLPILPQGRHTHLRVARVSIVLAWSALPYLALTIQPGRGSPPTLLVASPRHQLQRLTNPWWPTLTLWYAIKSMPPPPRASLFLTHASSSVVSAVRGELRAATSERHLAPAGHRQAQ